MKYEAVSNKDRAKPSAHIEMHDTKDVYGNNVGREVEDVFFPSGKLAVRKEAPCSLLKDEIASWDAQRAQLVKQQNPMMSCPTCIHPLGHLETHWSPCLIPETHIMAIYPCSAILLACLLLSGYMFT